MAQYRNLKAGDRITATMWGRPSIGTVTRIGQHGGAVFCQWDGSKRETFVHRESIETIQRKEGN